jgi:nucleotide-binding universal stress UspA family protein
MAMRIILAPIAGNDSDAAVLEAALTVARRFEAHIEVLHAKGDPRDAVPFLGEGASGALIEQIMEAAQRDAGEHASKARRQFDGWRESSGLSLAERPATGGPSATWHEETGAEDRWVAKRGRLADLIVVPQPTKQETVGTTIEFEAALLDTGKPVLVVPSAASASAMLSGPALILWNGSIESARAVTAALPLLQQAPNVVVLTQEEGGPASADAPAMVNFLAWHGIKSNAVTCPARQSGIGAQLLGEVESRKASFLVMGAYTHSRVRQMVFGGVTKHVLANGKVPTLMIH